MLAGWLEFNVPFQHKYGYITDELTTANIPWAIEKEPSCFICKLVIFVHGQVTIIMVALCNRADHNIFIL